MNKNLSEIFFRPIVFQEIERVVWPPSWLGHSPFALWLMESLRPKVVVELGTHTGNSFATFCQGAKFLDYQPRCYAVDTWEGDPHAGAYSQEVYPEVKQFFSEAYGSFSHLLRKTFKEALGDFEDASIDLLNIDGYHTYEATKEDFNSWLPKMSENGIVLIHDTNEFIADFGAWKFWDEIKEKYPSFSFLHSHGLGVVSVGKEIPKGMKGLFESDENEIGQIRKFFSHLGSLPVLKVTNDRLTEKNTELAEGLITGLEDCSLSSDLTGEEDRPAEASLRHQARRIKALLFELKSLGSLYEKERGWRQFVESSLGQTLDEVKNSIEIQTGWKRFIEQHLADNLEDAMVRLKSLGDSNLEGIRFKTFVQGHLGNTPQEALENLKNLGELNLDAQQYKSWMQQHLANTLEEASVKLENLLKCREEMQSLGHRTISFFDKKFESILR